MATKAPPEDTTSPWLVVPLCLGLAFFGFVVWNIYDGREDAVIVQLDAAGKPSACWELDSCYVDVGALVTWKCGKSFAHNRYVSPPFRVTEGWDYDSVGLQYRDKLCMRENGKR